MLTEYSPTEWQFLSLLVRDMAIISTKLIRLIPIWGDWVLQVVDIYVVMVSMQMTWRSHIDKEPDKMCIATLAKYTGSQRSHFPILKNYHKITKTVWSIWSFTNCSLTQKVCVYYSTLAGEPPSGPDHIKPIVQLGLCTGQNSSHLTSDCFSYLCMKGYTVAQLVEALRYKSEGCRINSWWCH
jgi:hypothetical protein